MKYDNIKKMVGLVEACRALQKQTRTTRFGNMYQRIEAHYLNFLTAGFSTIPILNYA